MSEWLIYWKPTEVEEGLKNGRPVECIWSAQLKRVALGDRVWIVSAPKGRLHLYGRIVVSSICPDETAGFEANCVAAMAEPMMQISLLEEAGDLVFDSPSGDTRLTVVQGLINAQQLQTMRKLSPMTAKLFADKWGSGLGKGDVKSTVQELKANKGGGFGDPEENRVVEELAVRFVTNHYQDAGWVVKSVEADKVGYDLECTKSKQTLRVEVKGVSGTKPEFIMTKNEIAAAETNPDFMLALVTEVRSSTPRLRQYSGRELRVKFIKTPLQFILKLKPQAR
jgi:hypothetical protein